MTECVKCSKFNTCQKSIEGYWDAQIKYPDKTWNMAEKRVEFIQELFKECKEYE